MTLLFLPMSHTRAGWWVALPASPVVRPITLPECGSWAKITVSCVLAIESFSVENHSDKRCVVESLDQKDSSGLLRWVCLCFTAGLVVVVYWAMSLTLIARNIGTLVLLWSTCYGVIASKFCTCQVSCAVVTCAKIDSDLVVMNCITIKTCLKKNWISSEKVRHAPCFTKQSHKKLTKYVFNISITSILRIPLV